MRRTVNFFRATATHGEIEWRDGYFIFALLSCVLAVDFGFYILNGTLDLLSGFVIFGSISGFGQLAFRAGLYLALVPIFFMLKTAVHAYLYEDILEKGWCPCGPSYLSLDWFANAVMLTTFPVAFQNIALWAVTFAVLAMGLWIIPALFEELKAKVAVRLTSLVSLMLLHLWVGAAGQSVLGLQIPSAGFLAITLPGEMITFTVAMVNSLLYGPFLVAGMSLVAWGIFSSDAFQSLDIIPVLDKTFPGDGEIAPVTIVISAMAGTYTYIALVYALRGTIYIDPLGFV